MICVRDKTLIDYIGRDEKLLLSLEEVVNPKHTALIVVDMQNEFIHGRGRIQPSPGKPLNANEKMVPKLVKFVGACREIGVPVSWIVTHHRGDIDFAVYKARMARKCEGPICIKGTTGAEIISEFVPRSEERIFVKHGYDGFTGNDLDGYLKKRGIVALIISGVGLDICVDATLKHGFHLCYYIVVGSNITSTLTKGVRGTYLRRFGEHYGLIASSQEIVKSWGLK